MNSDKIKSIISDTEDYLTKINKFYSGKLCIDKALPEEYAKREEEDLNPDNLNPDILNRDNLIQPATDKQSIIQNRKNLPKKKTVTDKKAVVEVDIFGNETVVKEEWEFAETLDELQEKIKDCKKCDLWKTRTNFVFGVGNPKADIVVIGEAPGADEDLQGEPFVGRAGKLLNKILEATGFSREEVFICNILKSRPPGNRNPAPEEVEVCKPYLDKQLKIINPKLVLLLGKVAAESLLKLKDPLGKIRGKIHDYKGWKVMVTFHPAALLRNPNWKRPAWEDMQQFKAVYDEMILNKL